MALVPGTRLGEYEILSALGAGGMGEVYRAHDAKLNRDVAIKVLLAAVAGDPDRLARFSREAHVLASLNHPNIAAIYGVEDSGDLHALVMELVEGPTLAERLASGSGRQASGRAIPLDEALAIAKQIAEALEAAHEQGIIHRDLKPANIKVRPDGTAKVLDFGLAKALESGAGNREPGAAANSPTLSMHATQAGIILGTAAYMSPEQARGRVVDRRADIWAYGVVLFEMLTGRRAFDAEDISATLAFVITKEPDWTALPATTPAAIRRLLRRCLEKDPKRRLQSIGDARLEIEEALIAPMAETSPAAAAQTARAGPTPLMIAAVLGTALVVALAMWIATRPAAPALAPLTRFSVDLGPGAIAGVRTTLVISPDGRRIVFPIVGANGNQQLATRLLDQATATPLPGTENGENPFFSPDGQWIGFGDAGTLKKISLLGGAAITLCEMTSGFRGGSWGEDGTIVAAANAEGLFRIPAAGGTRQPVTTLVKGETAHRWPQILPGGQLILFTSTFNSGVWEDATVQVLSVKTGQVITVVTGGYFGRYMDGYLTYVSRGVLFGLPFDLSGPSARGTPVQLLDDVASYPTGGAGQFDASQTGTFVYRSGKPARIGYPVVWLDRTAKTEPLLPKPDRYFTPRVSPDGRRLAVAADSGKGRDIYVYDMARDALSRLTFNGRSNMSPVWAPDGTHLVYAAFADKALMWMRADGAGEPQRLLESKNELTPTSFSPDGRFLSYVEATAEASKTDLWIVPVDASDPAHPKPGTPEVFLKTQANEGLGAAFSPDGRWLAYTADESGRPEVYVRPFHRAAGGKWQISTSGGSYSFWSRDGRALYYLGPDRRIKVVEYSATGESFTAGTPRVWSDTPVRPSPIATMDLAPDGKRFAILPQDMVSDEKGSVHVTFLLNFFDELRRRTGTQE